MYTKIDWLKLSLQIIGILLIIIGLYGRSISVLVHLPIVGGIAGCGIFLITFSLIGLAGAIKHHQVILFFVSFLPKIKISHSQLIRFDFFLDWLHSPCAVHDYLVFAIFNSILHCCVLFGRQSGSAATIRRRRLEPCLGRHQKESPRQFLVLRLQWDQCTERKHASVLRKYNGEWMTINFVPHISVSSMNFINLFIVQCSFPFLVSSPCVVHQIRIHLAACVRRAYRN